ncbi:MAG: hypothetical protein J7L82_03870 [Staphylothermus sp.]|nr:hypothetical protein [Staphylothermus sp.]
MDGMDDGEKDIMLSELKEIKMIATGTETAMGAQATGKETISAIGWTSVAQNTFTVEQMTTQGASKKVVTTGSGGAGMNMVLYGAVIVAIIVVIVVLILARKK